MKRTLIFLSFFLCFATVFAKTEIVYTDSNGLVTATILETKMTNLFPLIFSDVETIISFEGGAIQKEIHQHPEEFSRLYLLFGVVLPFVLVLLTSIKTSQENRNYLFMFYLSIIIAVAAAIFATLNGDLAIVVGVIGTVTILASLAGIIAATVTVFPSLVSEAVFGVAVVLSVVFASLAGAVAVTVGFDFGMKYIIFITVSCIVSYIARHFYFKHKEKKRTQSNYSVV